MSDDEAFAVIRERAALNAAQRDAALAVLADLVAYVRRVGGYSTPEDQLLLWRAAAVCEEMKR